MPERELDESRKKLAEARECYEAEVNAAATRAKASEDRYAELLEKISNQLQDIENLLRQKLNTSHDK